MELILIRHPRTVAPKGTCYGALDVEADPDCLDSDAARLESVIPKDVRIVSSPQKRALALASRLGTPETDPRLVELNFGDWENRLWDDIPRSEIDGWTSHVLDFAPPAGESLREMAARTLSWWQSVNLDNGSSLVAVGHGGPWRILAAHLTGTPLENAARFEIEWGGRAHWRITPEAIQLRGWNVF